MNTAPKSLDQILARNVRLALGPYNDDDRPITELIVQLRNKLTALAPPSGEGVDSYWIHASAWNEIVLDQPLGDDQYSKGYSEALNAITRNLCALPKPAATPQSAPVDGDSSDLGEVRFPAKGGVWGYGA